jgi:Xaa-Pro aminopeptidase
VLLDLWGRFPGDDGVFADITWVGFVGSEVPAKYKAVFEIVRRARDAVVERLQAAWKQGEVLQGWQLDQVARQVIEQAGYGPCFVHRTGHSLGPGPSAHGLGVNLDNLETHDTRLVVPGVGFSVEPGIYLEEFGVRSEINVFMHPEKGPLVTTPLQNEIVRLASVDHRLSAV